MAKTRALVNRRKAIRNIRKITRTMELIATARFKKAFDRATEAEAFTNKIAELAADLSARATNIKHPLLEKREVIKNSLLLVICSNRGLCGGYNTSIIRAALARTQQMPAENATLHLELSGKRAITYFRYQGLNAENKYTHFEDKPSFEEVAVLADRYLAEYIAGKIDRVEVAYMKFLNAARQTPVVETLLPLSTLAPEPGRHTPKEAHPLKQKIREILTKGYLKDAGDRVIISDRSGGKFHVQIVSPKLSGPRRKEMEDLIRADLVQGLGLDAFEQFTLSFDTHEVQVEYEFMPSAGDILQELLPMSFKIRLFKCFLDAAVSEQIARRVAMKAATENAGDMIKTLTRQYNRARQAQITKEIAEVIGGVEALK